MKQAGGIAESLQVRIDSLEENLHQMVNAFPGAGNETKTNIIKQKQIKDEISLLKTRLRQFEPLKTIKEEVFLEQSPTASDGFMSSESILEQKPNERTKGRTLDFEMPIGMKGLFESLKTTLRVPVEEQTKQECEEVDLGNPITEQAGDVSNAIIDTAEDLPTDPHSPENPTGSHPSHSWVDLYPIVPIEIAVTLQALFVDSEEFDAFLKKYIPVVSWLIMSAMISDCSRRTTPDNFEKLLENARNKEGNWHEFPVDQISALRKDCRLGEIAPHCEGSEKYRKEFIVRFYLFKALSSFQPRNIDNQVEERWRSSGGNILIPIEFCKSILNRKGKLNRDAFEARKFLNVCTSVRNAYAHQWRADGFDCFDEKAFNRACFPAFKMAFLEFLNEESWIFHLAIGNFCQKNQQNESIFRLNRIGYPYLVVKDLGPCGVDFPNDSEWIVDTEEKRVLFEFKRFGWADKKALKRSGLMKGIQDNEMGE